MSSVSYTMSWLTIIYKSLTKRRVICKIVAFIALLYFSQLFISYLYQRELLSESVQRHVDVKVKRMPYIVRADGHKSLNAPNNQRDGHKSLNAHNNQRDQRDWVSPEPQLKQIREFYQRNPAPENFEIKLGGDDTGALRRQPYQNNQPSDHHQQLVNSDGHGNIILKDLNGATSPRVKREGWKSHDYENAPSLLQIRVDRAPDHREGQGRPWPMPQELTPGNEIYKVDMDRFRILLPTGSCGRLNRASERYTQKIRNKVDLFIPEDFQYKKLNETGVKDDVIRSLKIQLLGGNCGDTDVPREDMLENYRISIDRTGAHLSASEVWGLIRGLETFSQLIWFDEIDFQHAVIESVQIRDFPRFRFRGLHIDTARHFIPPRSLFKLMDAMSYNKFNVLQWHITDDQSFPYVSERFPLLHKKGAYSKRHVYRPKDIQALIQYGADRGIRIIPEFDLPGHTRSWGLGYPKLLTNCSKEFYPFGAVNPINNYTYDFLKLFWEEIGQVFPDSYQHIGGDEINYDCWLAVKEIRDFMINKNMTKEEFDYLKLDGDQLQGYFLKKLLEVMPKDRQKVAWEEAFIAARMWNISRDQLVINVWKGGDFEWQYMMEAVVKGGYRAILSAPWYLNYISYGTDWHKYYSQDPLSFLYYNDGYGKRRPRKELLRKNLNKYKDLVLGGQVCLWSEFVDESNLETTLWPRAIAPAERFWSSDQHSSWQLAQPRFEQQACRMARRGIRTSPNSGPGTCYGTMKIKPPFEPPGGFY